MFRVSARIARHVQGRFRLATSSAIKHVLLRLTEAGVLVTKADRTQAHDVVPPCRGMSRLTFREELLYPGLPDEVTYTGTPPKAGEEQMPAVEVAF